MTTKTVVFETPEHKHRVTFAERGFTPNTPDACSIGVRNWVVWTHNHLIVEIKATVTIPLDILATEAHNVENTTFDRFVGRVCERFAATFPPDERVSVYNYYR